MKKLFLIAMLLSFVGRGQSCKPYAEINGHKGTSEITAAELATLNKIIVAGTCKDEKYFVTSYELTMMRKNQPYSLTGWTGKIDEKIMKALQGAEPGSKVFIDNIHAKGVKGVIDVAGITLIVKK